MQSDAGGQGAEHELAKATVYGFGLGQQSRQARLTVHWSNKEDSIVVVHELQHRRQQAGLEWREEDVIVVQPTEQRDREVIQPGYSEFPDSRVVCEWNDHAPRAYVRHEERHNGDWIPVAGWEIHSATGIDSVYGRDDDEDLVADGGEEVGRAIHRFRRWLGYKILPGTDAEHAAQARFMAQGELNRAYKETGETALGEAYRSLDRYVPVRPRWERENDEVRDA